MAVYKKVPGCETVNISTLEFDTKPTKGSFNPVTSDGIANAVGSVPEGGSKTGADLVDGTLAIEGAGSWTSLTLTTEDALTILANEGTPNFAITVDNSGNSNGVTVTVKDSTGNNTLKHSSVAGATIAANTIAQITAVGDCWAFTYFEA